jgi:hypothetical protein
MKALVVVLLVIVVYFAPTILAALRTVPNVGSILVINFFLGWTFIGWVVALAMAARSHPAVTQVNVEQNAGYEKSARERDEDVLRRGA